MRSALVLFLEAIIMAGGPARSEDSTWLYGIHWFGPLSNNADVSEMTGGKKIWVLETVMTNEGSGGFGPDAQLAGFRNVVDRGHTLIIRVQPVWGKAFPLPADTNPDMDTFLDQVGRMAALYKDVCHIWHLGNEMNLDFEWGDRKLEPEDYVEAAARFSDRIHSATSSLGPQMVLVGPTSPGPAEGKRWMSSTEYLSRMCDAVNDRGYRDRFQGFAIHSYAAAHTTELEVCLYGFDDHPENGFRHQLAIMDKKSFEEYPVYMTEWNRYTKDRDPIEEAASARVLHHAFAALDKWNRSGGHPIACACWFVYPESSGWSEYSLKGLKSDGDQNKDLWHAYQYAARRGYRAGYPAKDRDAGEH